MTRHGMGRRRLTHADEQDAFTRWRFLYPYLARPGVRAAIKRKTHKRERQDASRAIRTERTQQ